MEISKKDTKEDKYKRIVSRIITMSEGDITTPTALAKDNLVHKNTLCDLLDLFDSLSETGIETIRDSEGKIKFIRRSNKNLDIKKEIREVKKEMLDIRNILDEINLKLSSKEINVKELKKADKLITKEVEKIKKERGKKKWKKLRKQ